MCIIDDSIQILFDRLSRGHFTSEQLDSLGIDPILFKKKVKSDNDFMRAYLNAVELGNSYRIRYNYVFPYDNFI